VGVVDTDVQSLGSHILFGLDESEIDQALDDYLAGRCSIEEAIYDVGRRIGDGEIMSAGGSLYLIPSCIHISEVERILREECDVCSLNDAFEAFIGTCDLDYLFVDAPAGLGARALISVAISDLLLILLRPDQQDFQGTAVVTGIARGLGIPHRQLVINMAFPSQNADELKRQVEQAYRSPVAAVLPFSQDMVWLASADVFCLCYPDSPYSHRIQQIVAAVEVVNPHEGK
jgi:MinD-like ATPase involved in chromosome partitioning or flagellar assembly